MKHLTRACKGSHAGSDIFGSLPPSDPEPAIGTVYGVPEHLSASGIARLLSYHHTGDRFGWKGSDCFWSLYLLSIPEPDDPCDSDFMRSIST